MTNMYVTRVSKYFLSFEAWKALSKIFIIASLFSVVSLPAFSEEEEDEVASVDEEVSAETAISRDVEDLKKAALELNRDLLILEEELLFPSSTQLAVFLSLDVGNYFRLDSVKLKVDDKLVASHLYTMRQNDSLSKGGVQRLYLGNIRNGEHEITAIFTGMGPDSREYKRGATISIEKEDEATMLELRIRDSSVNMQPEFDIKEWQL